MLSVYTAQSLPPALFVVPSAFIDQLRPLCQNASEQRAKVDRARLAQLYGEAQAVTIGPGLHGGAAVAIVVPYREA